MSVFCSCFGVGLKKCIMSRNNHSLEILRNKLETYIENLVNFDFVPRINDTLNAHPSNENVSSHLQSNDMLERNKIIECVACSNHTLSECIKLRVFALEKNLFPSNSNEDVDFPPNIYLSCGYAITIISFVGIFLNILAFIFFQHRQIKKLY